MVTRREPQFHQHHPDFSLLTGAQANIQLLLDTDNANQPHFHEACVYHAKSESILVTSNQITNQSHDTSSTTRDKHVKLFRIYDRDIPSYEELDFDGCRTAVLNGGVNHGEDSILFCAQGSRDPSHVSGIVSLTIPEPGEVCQTPKVVVPDFHGIPFNSVNDVVVHPRDGSIWFTDPCYGYHQGIRNTPQLPNQVYRYDPTSKSIRAVADGFTRPNGLCFSPDAKTLYITDTGAIHGSSSVPIDPAGPSSIYAFDVMTTKTGGTFLTNRRLFAFASGRFPDGIKCDTVGNVYSGCGNGIQVWNCDGESLGLIEIPGGVANFCFGKEGTIYACNETKFWKGWLDQNRVKGALLGI